MIPSKKYIEIVISCEDDQKDLLVAELDALNFNSIMETDDGVNAYIEEDKFKEEDLYELKERYGFHADFSELEEKNWNSEWEKNFNPVVIEDYCYIRAPFHSEPAKSYRYELVILPRMSFGTGHHATTHLMVKSQIEKINHKNKKVLDAGCGTAILAIMAEKLGASEVIAYDIDEWSIDNAPENISLNNCSKVTVLGGTIGDLQLKKDFDIVLANINKNVLIEEVAEYAKHLVDNGLLLLSGYFKEDEQEIQEVAKQSGLKYVSSDYKDRWTTTLFRKIA